jgi:hypothetical protein
VRGKEGREGVLEETLESLDVNGAAHEASPSLILGGSFSSSISASLSVILAKSNCRIPSQSQVK